MNAHTALLIVDLQNDFCPGGALPVTDGDKIVPVINRYIDLFRERGFPVLASRDWHPEVTSHFKKYGGIWPVHCVQESEGAKFHLDLLLPPDAIIITKGTDPSCDDYSAMHGVADNGMPLPELLRTMAIEELYICGLATDYCVKETVLAALGNGFAVTLLTDACRGVNLAPGDSEQALAEMKAAGATELTLANLTKK